MRLAAEEFSKAVFGSEKRLAILAAIADAVDDDCYPTRIAELSGAPTNAVSGLMTRLVAAGVLEPIEAGRGVTLKRHRKTQSALWSLASGLFAEFSR